ncbi:MAG: RluA family pseudouridine synthase [Phycisphaeraceae bacterium]|nr:RluA family pseudouridine synthase [Phycisphaeraceae bacterium]
MTDVKHTYKVSSDCIDMRLDRYVANLLSLSRKQVRELITIKAITINDITADKAGTLLAVDDHVQVDPNKAQQLHTITPNPDLDIPILFEDEELLIVNKPPNMGVHPLGPLQTDTVINGLLAKYPQIQGVGEGGLRSGVVHRLDVDTTGTLIIALTDTGYQIGREAITDKQNTLKQYRALVHGKLPHDEQAVHRNLVMAQHKPARVKVIKNATIESRHCSLRSRVLETFKNASYIEVDLQTGFLHQIRVLLEHLGNPILGDTLYGESNDLPRCMLHAHHIQFGIVDITAPIPEDMNHALDQYR